MTDYEIKSNISSTLIRLRKSHGMNQTQAGAIVGVPKTTYATWEQGKSMPAADRPNYRQAYDWMKSKGFTPHSTRYTFATRAHECKMDELTIRKIMGHAPENILQKVYTQISMEEMKKRDAEIQLCLLALC